MMIRLLAFVFFLQVLGGGNCNPDTFTCTAQTVYPKETCYDKVCTDAIVSHINHEFNAAFKYLYMGAKFGQYTVARPGITKFLLESASEERSHAIQMLDYLNTRGIKYTEPYKFNDAVPEPSDIESALTMAIQMEIDVTSKIREVVKTCSNDFHAADVFTNPILDEQHTGLRKLQGALKTLKVMKVNSHDDPELIKMAEYFFDLKVLKGDLL